ncbi:Putative fumarate reductase/succinate dehydrogenase cytochrome b subunit, b558 family (sdhC/frdC) [Candidatus Sulfobium mesophilum]|uniref:Fumarate reductase/succinate dehydrogenase cytochrome b subunit, b558 family (SdhC/frdC) n=1 Tax=Candidatus Sulfobium mesophilum TaxID=2016548 RepID=A0A2U3QJU9_9BACT|nr:Putative fumarate reductase/succinate dehydrogenase cytochrome b subunit, b558 family (sdhC/frdC) [Candidatus Sulfobium mesophilum]
MYLLRSQVGRKIVMAVSGFSMLAFVVVHLLGNTSMYGGPGSMNAYASALHRFPLLIWLFRLILMVMFYLHVFYGIALKLENRDAKPEPYVVEKYKQSTFAGRNMIWTGLLIGAFVVYHLLHFTFQVTNPQISAGSHPDAMGRPDVFMMVMLSFRKLAISAVYISAMIVLGLHLSHSIQSGFQTVGLNNDRSFPIAIKGGMVVAILITLGFAAFPIVIFTGILR